MAKVSIKLLSPQAQIPQAASTGAAGFDVTACLQESLLLEPYKAVLVPSGISVQIPLGYEIQVRSRSGLALKNQVFVLNSPGTIDSDYRGEIKIILFNIGQEAFQINPGDRIAQLVMAKVEKIEFEASESLAESLRGDGGFGSTGV